MKNSQLRIASVCIAVILLSSVRAGAQATTQPTDDAANAEMKRRFMDMVQRTSAPTEQHKMLAPLAGDFDVATEVHLGPGEPMRARGVGHGHWIMGGRFVQLDETAAPDEPLKGERMVIYGYDPAAQKYTMWQIESASLTASSATGDYDPASKTFTFEGNRGESNKPAFRWRVKIEDDGSITQTIEMKRPGAQEFAEFVKVRRTRRKS
jgi:hypothetical protein